MVPVIPCNAQVASSAGSRASVTEIKLSVTASAARGNWMVLRGTMSTLTGNATRFARWKYTAIGRAIASCINALIRMISNIEQAERTVKTSESVTYFFR